MHALRVPVLRSYPVTFGFRIATLLAKICASRSKAKITVEALVLYSKFFGANTLSFEDYAWNMY